MSDDRTRQVQDAFARGQEALGAGDKVGAVRWLERAHRLAPLDGTITLVLASVAIGADNAKAASLFAEVLANNDVRDAWLGLATARFLMRDLPGARAAVAECLGRFALWPGVAGLADQMSGADQVAGAGQAAGADMTAAAPGWCGLTGDGEVVAHSGRQEPMDVRMDGRRVRPLVPRHGEAHLPGHGPIPLAGHGPVEPGNDGGRAQAQVQPRGIALPPAWPRGRWLTVTVGERHLLGSPISLRAIGRVEGQIDPRDGGLRGWAWHPGDPDRDPVLTVETNATPRMIVATEPALDIPGLPPLARPRSFAIPQTGVNPRPSGNSRAPVRVYGRDGLDLPFSPLAPGATDMASITHATKTPKPKRRPTDLARWRGGDTRSVVLVTHDDGGGVERRVQASAASHEARGRRAIVLRPAKLADGSSGIVATADSLPELRFELPREQPALLRLLLGTRPVETELHHFLNHDPSVFEIIRALSVPYDIHTHDYAWFCPRIALVGGGDRYCGEPAPTECEACVAKSGSYLNEAIGVPALLGRSRNILSGARRIVAPSHDAAERMARHFPGISPIVIPHEDDAAIGEPPPVPRVDGMVRVCVAGAIGLHKGFHVLLACARDAEKRGLELTFVVAGTTIDDQRLMDTGRVFVTGPYQPDEAVALIRAQDAALALLPSIWPETWCLGLTELWRAGLRVAAFDIGAPAERIRRTGRGMVLPLGLAPPSINDALLNAVGGRSFLPIRRSSAYKPSN